MREDWLLHEQRRNIGTTLTIIENLTESMLTKNVIYKQARSYGLILKSRIVKCINIWKKLKKIKRSIKPGTHLVFIAHNEVRFDFLP